MTLCNRSEKKKFYQYFLWGWMTPFGLYVNACVVSFITASLILKENKSGGGEIAALMVLLLFDEVATIETWWAYLSSLFKIFHPAQTRAPPFGFLLCFLLFFFPSHFRSDKVNKAQTAFSLPLSLTRRWTQVFSASWLQIIAGFKSYFFIPDSRGVDCKDSLSKQVYRSTEKQHI